MENKWERKNESMNGGGVRSELTNLHLQRGTGGKEKKKGEKKKKGWKWRDEEWFGLCCW